MVGWVNICQITHRITESDVTSEFTNPQIFSCYVQKNIFSHKSFQVFENLKRVVPIHLQFQNYSSNNNYKQQGSTLVINLIKNKIAGRCGTRNLPTGKL